MKRLAIIFLLFATGCAHDLTAPLSAVPVASMADYFWTGSPISFKDNSTGVITDQFTFRDSSGFLLADDADENGKLRTTIFCTISADTVFAQNFVFNSVLDLDFGSYFTSLDTVLPMPQLLSEAVITGDGTDYVATDSGVWSAPYSGIFSYDGIGTISDIDAMTYSEGDSIFAATRSGQIWMRDPSGKWSLPATLNAGLPAGPIKLLACDIGMLYAVIDGQTGVYQFSKHGGYWTQIPFLNSSQITAIRSGTSLNATQYLAIGTSDGTVGGYPTSGAGTKFLQTITGAGKINDFALVATSHLDVTTDNGIYQGNLSTNFPSQPAISNSATSLVYDPSGTLYFISDGTVFSAPSSGGSAATPLTKYYDGAPLKLLTSNSASYLLTNTSIYKHSVLWDTVPGFPRTYYPNLQGGLVLLKSNPTMDSSWRAGTLVTKNNQSYPITARLLSRLDSLLIGGKSYPDILVVRYSYEGSGEMPDASDLPYWVIYYQRGRGPIMFDRVNIGGGPPERRVLIN